MMNPADLDCGVATRRKKLFKNENWNGLDFLEVSEDQLSLCVHFFGEIPQGITVENIKIHGGRRIQGIRAVDVTIDQADEDADNCLHIKLDKFGDFSTYRLCLVELATPEQNNGFAEKHQHEPPQQPMQGLDPRYSCLDFSFKTDCASDFDCRPVDACPPETLSAPEINYLAKDYATFRQLMLDRLALTMPEWRERHVPDIGITLVELLAYVGDHLSYYQDAVATEAYLDTARLRTSVRRHVRLVDYRMHEGVNARAFVAIATDGDLLGRKADDFFFMTGFPGIVASSGRVVRSEDLLGIRHGRYEVFEPLTADPAQTFDFRAAHSRIRFYTWGDMECCLPRGATRATLVDEPEAEQAGPDDAQDKPRVLHLASGDILIFQEVIGPTTGDPDDADGTRRHAVRITRATCSVDGLYGRNVLEIEWGAEDALPFPLCLSTRLPAPDCRRIEDVSIACGNVVLVDHGRTVGENETFGPVEKDRTIGDCACDGSVIETTDVPRRFTAVLAERPLVFSEPLPPSASAARSIAQDPRNARPALALAEDGNDTVWWPRYDLLASRSDDRHFVTEVDDEGRAKLRFGDGELGRMPSVGTMFRPIPGRQGGRRGYRVGYGPDGNVGRDTINHIVLRHESLSGLTVEPINPLPAQGGTAPEPVAMVKLLAPSAFRTHRARAITADDYAELAQHDADIQRAAAELRWTGSWYEAHVALDPAHRTEAEPALFERIAAALETYRRVGHDLAVEPARYVPIDLALHCCVLPHYPRGQVNAELAGVLGDRQLPDGRLGFFHPDRLTFGSDIYLSQIVAAAKAVEGVGSVTVTRLQRLHAPGGDAIESGVLRFDTMEVAQLANDPNYPENGKLTLVAEGGR